MDKHYLDHPFKGAKRLWTWLTKDLLRRCKKRLPARAKRPLVTSGQLNETRSMDWEIVEEPERSMLLMITIEKH